MIASGSSGMFFWFPNLREPLSSFRQVSVEVSIFTAKGVEFGQRLCTALRIDHLPRGFVQQWCPIYGRWGPIVINNSIFGQTHETTHHEIQLFHYHHKQWHIMKLRIFERIHTIVWGMNPVPNSAEANNSNGMSSASSTMPFVARPNSAFLRSLLCHAVPQW